MAVEKKIFMSDLDGTLLTTDKKVSPATSEALKKFVEGGGHFAISTGRDINSARSVYDQLGLDLPGSFVAAYNGGQIYEVDSGKTIYRIGIDQKMVREIFRLAEEMNIYIHTYNDDYILSPFGGECLDYYKMVIKTPAKTGWECLDFLDVPPCKMISIELHDHEKQEAFKREVEKRYGDHLTLMYSSEYYLELIPKESGKGESLKKLSDYLGIPMENTMAAGDEDNDITMIQAAGTGIAMLNASDKVKAIADKVTNADNDHDGLVPFLSKVTMM